MTPQFLPNEADPEVSADVVLAVAKHVAHSGMPALATIARFYLAAHAGEVVPASAVATTPPPEPVACHPELSERELGVLKLLARGYSNKEIATRLDVSVKTVETYKARAMDKLKIEGRVELVRYAAVHGWLTD